MMMCTKEQEQRQAIEMLCVDMPVPKEHLLLPLTFPFVEWKSIAIAVCSIATLSTVQEGLPFANPNKPIPRGCNDTQTSIRQTPDARCFRCGINRSGSLLSWGLPLADYSETLAAHSLAHLAAPFSSSSEGCLPPNRPLPEQT